MSLSNVSACPSSTNTRQALACVHTESMPAGLKMENYRSPTPDCVPHGQTLDVTGLQEIIKEGKPVLIDVWAIIYRYDEGFGSMWLQNDPHYSLPDTVWLPNVGYGEIKPIIENYFKSNLERLTAGDKERPLVFFCVSDCWMSWNAVQRAHEYGYTQLYWFKDGTDGWEAEGFNLNEVEPEPIEAFDE